MPVDVPLVVSGDRLRFSVPLWTFPPVLELDIARAGMDVSGTIGGTWPSGCCYEASISKTSTRRDRALLSGSADKDGRLTGTFDGYLWAGNSYYTWLECAGSFTWTLTPRR